MNIVSNAIKFSNNSTTVEVKVHAKSIIKCKKGSSEKQKESINCDSERSSNAQSALMSKSFNSYINETSTLKNQ